MVSPPGADAERYRCACLHCTQGLAWRGDGYQCGLDWGVLVRIMGTVRPECMSQARRGSSASSSLKTYCPTNYFLAVCNILFGNRASLLSSWHQRQHWQQRIPDHRPVSFTSDKTICAVVFSRDVVFLKELRLQYVSKSINQSICMRQFFQLYYSLVFKNFVFVFDQTKTPKAHKLVFYRPLINYTRHHIKHRWRYHPHFKPVSFCHVCSMTARPDRATWCRFYEAKHYRNSTQLSEHIRTQVSNASVSDKLLTQNISSTDESKLPAYSSILKETTQNTIFGTKGSNTGGP